MPNFADMKPQPLSQTLQDVLREAIIDGTLKPGESLVQATLAAEFGVSLAPVREALTHLEEEGFVRSVPFKGSTVASPTTKDFEELRSLRNILEQWAGTVVIARRRSSDLVEIEAAYEQLRIEAVEGNIDRVDMADLRLHETICELADNALLLEVWNRYAHRFRWILTFCNRVNEDIPRIVDMHEPLINAFRAWDEEALRDFYEHHQTNLVPFLPEGDGEAKELPRTAS